MMLWLLLVFAAPLVAYQLWHAVGLIASLVACRRQALPADPGDATARVAILYATCDDFRASACRTLLDQHGVRFDLYILDDSTDAELQAAVDAWARQQSRTVHVVRRSDRRGHKAGNLNHWLATCGDPARYRYALLVDADEHVPPDFRFSACSIRRSTASGVTSWRGAT